MRVLVGCEFSGAVRDAFIRRGWDALSADLSPSMKPGPHYQGDMFDLIDDGWDLVIAHPPCTYLTHSQTPLLKVDPTRVERMLEGAAFFNRCLAIDAPHVAVENPVMSPYAQIHIRPHDFQVQPFQFGHSYSKKTRWWVKDLPPLVPTQLVQPMLSLGGGNVHDSHSVRDHFGRLRTRSEVRSITPRGMADAIAQQWGQYVENSQHETFKVIHCAHDYSP